MMLEKEEMEKLGQAFIFLGYSSYNSKQQEFITEFLKKYAENWQEEKINTLFNQNTEMIKSLKVLNQFVTKYRSQEELYNEFKDELNELMISINGRDETISI